ncbi:MAG TPA: hypothetical protein VI916_02960 [Acidimicrobiia bacterium]|nr:hypothetical protein [Acidimicrobiia bacterium]
MRRRALAALVAVAAVVACLAVSGTSGATFGRDFRARARAYPVEPDPGSNQTSFSFRPVAVEGGIASAPIGANARAAVVDLGFIENLTVEGEQIAPEDSFARCDTVSPNVPDEEERNVGSASLSARCTEGPAFEARSAGVAPSAVLPPAALEPFGISGGQISSRVSASASGSTVFSDTVNAVTDLTIGPLHIEEIRFHARVEAAGEPRTASAVWSVDVMAADVQGVPVVIGTDGVQVDSQKVPEPLAKQTTAAIQEGFARSGGFMDVRIVAPASSAADDGSAAEVKGGGLHIFMTSGTEVNDREYLGLTFLGGHTSVNIGEPRAAGFVLQPFTAGAPRVAGAVIDRPTVAPSAVARAGTAPAPAAAVAAPGRVEPPRVSLARATARRSLPAPSSWWMVVLVVGIALLALGATSIRGPLAPARARSAAWWNVTAERFLRG